MSNFFIRGGGSFLTKKILGIAPKRNLPACIKSPSENGIKSIIKSLKTLEKSVYLFCDEFTNFNDVQIGIKAIQLLTKLNYEVKLIDHPESGRAYLSKGILLPAQKVANENVALFNKLVGKKTPLIGIEPSAILGFRDEYPKLVSKELQEKANKLKKHVFLIDEFLNQEIQNGNISSDQFTKEKRKILLHGHCHQKALSAVDHSAWILGLPENYEVEVIPSGCCGMAGSFGYEKEHYDVSMKIGELVLFPAIRKSNTEIIIAAPGTSCRHQIFDGTKRQALHPIEILWEALH